MNSIAIFIAVAIIIAILLVSACYTISEFVAIEKRHKRTLRKWKNRRNNKFFCYREEDTE